MVLTEWLVKSILSGCVVCTTIYGLKLFLVTRALIESVDPFYGFVSLNEWMDFRVDDRYPCRKVVAENF